MNGSRRDGDGDRSRLPVEQVIGSWDWATTSVGPPRTWPAPLRQVVEILLASRFSMWLGWGPDLAVFYNDAYRRDTLQAKHPWALGRPAREVWAEIWDDIGPRIESVLRTGEATWDEGLLLFLERAGYLEETYHTFSYSPLRDEDRQVAGFLCVVSEDTERVLGDRRLRVLGELGDISAVTAPTVEQACTAALEVLERHRADVPFASIYLFDPAGDPAGDTARLTGSYGMLDDPSLLPRTLRRDTHPNAPVWEMLATGRAQVLEDLHTRFAGLFVPMPAPMDAGELDAVLAVPLAGSGGGSPAGVLFAGISPFRRLDAEYRQFVELVAGQVSTSIADAVAYQDQRRRAEELAELDRAKTEFFAGVSHELRTPLTLIAGPAEDALGDAEAPLPPAQRTRMEVIARNSGRLRRLVDTMLEFARLEAGRAVPDRVPVDLAALTRGIAESFAPAVSRAGLDFAIDCPPLGSAVSVDVDMWEKIVLNLLSNAVKYTHEGHIRISLRGTPEGGVELAVADTGIGVPAPELPRLFERFHRVRGASGRSHEGSGIGLAMVAELAELHRGAAAARSTAGGGSTFVVTLPPDARSATPPVTPAVSTAVALYREEAMQWSPGGGEVAPDRGATPTATDEFDAVGVAGTARDGAAHVLVVEDNRDLRGFLTRLLTPHYRVSTAADGITALNLVRRDRPDLVLTDVMMPGLDGFELIARLRDDPATATLPVVMLSARAGEEAAGEGLAAGADDYLVKPFSSQDLLARVRSNLELARLRNREGAWRTALVNALQDGLFVVAAEGAVIEVNQAFTDLLGYDAAGLPYPTPHPWWPDPEDDPEGHALLADAARTVRAIGGGRYVLPLRHRDGRRLWASCSVSTIAGSGSEGSIVVGVVRDVTAEHRARLRDRLLADTGELLNRGDDLRSRLTCFAALAASALADLVVISLAQPDGRLRPVAAAHPRRPEIAAKVLDLPPQRVPATLAARYDEGKPFLLDGVPDIRVVDARSALVVPLIGGGRMLGSMTIAATEQPGDHDDVDVQTAQELGRRIATAIQADRIATREQHLHSVTAALAAAGTVGDVAAVLASSMDTVLGATSAAVYIPGPDDPGHLYLMHTAGAPRGAATVGLASDDPVARAARDRDPLWLGGWDGAGAEAPAAAALPLLVGKKVVGVLALGFPSPRLFPPDERSFAVTLAGQAALALDRAAISDARWEIAQTLQLGLLPSQLPALPRVAMAARYLPAGTHTAAGGDWYDVTVLDEDRTAVTVGDVVGHGAHAAAVMGQLRAALSAYLLDGRSPADALQRLSRFAVTIEGARGSTAICLVLTASTGEICWARAGHLPPLVVDAGGPRFLGDAHGVLLGVPGAPPITESHVILAPGDAVLLYTDGMVERRGEVVDDGLARLAAALGRHRSTPTPQVLPAVLDSVLDRASPADDVAAVLLRLRPGPLSATHPARPAELAAVRREVEAWAAQALLPDEQLEDLQLALGEALTNSVDHAYRDPPRAGAAAATISYELQLRPDGGVEVRTGDIGSWRPPPADPGHRGHGLRAIRALSTGLDISHDGAGTRLRFTVPAPPSSPRAATG